MLAVSTAGRMHGAADSRAFTVRDVMDIQNNIKGDALIWENVPSVPEDYLRELTLALEQAGYYVSLLSLIHI